MWVPFFHAQYDWTTGVPDNGIEWTKCRAVPRLYPLRSLVCTLLNKGGSRRAFRLPGTGGDHFHCTVEPSPSHIRCRFLHSSPAGEMRHISFFAGGPKWGVLGGLQQVYVENVYMPFLSLSFSLMVLLFQRPAHLPDYLCPLVLPGARIVSRTFLSFWWTSTRFHAAFRSSAAVRAWFPVSHTARYREETIMGDWFLYTSSAGRCCPFWQFSANGV